MRSPFAPLLLTLLGMAAAFVPLALLLPDFPLVVPFGLTALAVVWGILAWKWAKQRRRLHAGLALVEVAALAFLAVYVFVIIPFEPAVNAPVVGAEAPEVTARRVSDDATFHLSAQRGNSVLLVFSRGAW